MSAEPFRATEPEPVLDAPQRLVLVTGAGRSGTSTVAGSLHHLGLHVPLPVLNANQTNPRGFFESKWPLKFHKQVLARAFVDPFDARPEALSQMSEAVSDEDRDKLCTWLEKQSHHAPQLAVKDPRSSWLTGLWSQTAANLGMRIGFLSMLRHPAEVIGSRSTYYGKNQDAAWLRRYGVVKLAGWVNANLVVERQTRGLSRAFVRYYDLIEDWRSVMSSVGEDLSLTYNTHLDPDRPHPLDEFIDPDLRRVRVTWDELDVPDALREMAEDVWAAYDRLIDTRGTDEKAEERLDAIAERYAGFYADAQAVAHDTIAAEKKRARSAGRRETRQKMQQKVAEAKTSAREARAEARAARAEPPTVRGLVARVVAGMRRRIRRR